MPSKCFAVVLFVVTWIGLGVCGTGYDVAYFQGKYHGNCREDLGQSLVMAIAGPMNLLTSYLYTGFGEHGWILSCK